MYRLGKGSLQEFAGVVGGFWKKRFLVMLVLTPGVCRLSKRACQVIRRENGKKVKRQVKVKLREAFFSFSGTGEKNAVQVKL